MPRLENNIQPDLGMNFRNNSSTNTFKMCESK